MRKSLGNKRNELSDEHIDEVTRIYGEFTEGEHCKIFANEDFGYRKITVERPLRLNFQASPERVERLRSRRRSESSGPTRTPWWAMLAAMPDEPTQERPEFEAALEERRPGRRHQARRSAEEGHPRGALRARRDRPRLPRRQGRPRARP